MCQIIPSPPPLCRVPTGALQVAHPDAHEPRKGTCHAVGPGGTVSDVICPLAEWFLKSLGFPSTRVCPAGAEHNASARVITGL